MSTLSSTFADRLKQAMHDAGWPVKASVLHQKFNEYYPGPPISWQTARNWLSDNFLPRDDKLQALADLLHVKPAYLLWGTSASPTAAASPAPGAPSPSDAGHGISPGDRTLWDNYQSITPERQALVRHVVAIMQSLVRHVVAIMQSQQVLEDQLARSPSPDEQALSAWFDRHGKLLADLHTFSRTGM